MSEAEAAVVAQQEEGAKGRERGGWAGSIVREEDLAWLRASRRIPAGVACRLAAGEISPSPREGEYVVSLSHFQRGFGLPTSNFFFDFISTYKLQPHHLPANAITSLSSFASGIEGYIGLWPTKELWIKFFGMRNVVTDKELWIHIQHGEGVL